MPFTDDDLKRLKDHGIHCGFREEIEALLARLEAAEKALAHVEKEGFKYHPVMEAWKKAAGK